MGHGGDRGPSDLPDSAAGAGGAGRWCHSVRDPRHVSRRRGSGSPPGEAARRARGALFLRASSPPRPSPSWRGAQLDAGHRPAPRRVRAARGRRDSRALHRRIGEALESRSDADVYVYELAHHFWHAEEPERAFTYSLRAGERAERSYANERALELFQRTLELLPRTAQSDAKALETRI